jgi:hypothetical protein
MEVLRRRLSLKRTPNLFVNKGRRNVSKLKYPEWQTSCQEALFESDKKKLEAKIRLAEWKIFRRLQTISADSNHHEEKVAIADVLANLHSLHSPIGIPVKCCHQATRAPGTSGTFQGGDDPSTQDGR